MNGEKLLDLSKKVLLETGIIIEKIQYGAMEKFIAEKSRLKNLPEEDYIMCLLSDRAEFEQFICAITINETYFFREEKQFLFLKDVLFPKFYGKKIKIWSGACSTGEEAFSLLALALEMGLDAEIFASDIDGLALEKLKNGIYTKNSFRMDGKAFHSLIEKYGRFLEDGRFVFDRYFVSKVKPVNYNLLDGELPDFAFDVDLIFLRNVFIYFAEDNRQKIFKKVSSALSTGGCILFSMNEVGCISDRNVPDFMERRREGQVFYFRKTDEKILKKTSVENAESLKKPEKYTREFFVQEGRAQRLSEKLKNDRSREDGFGGPGGKRPDLKQRVNLKKREDLKKKLAEKPSLAEINEKILRLVNERKFSEAEAEARILAADVSTKAFSYFYSGYIQYSMDDRQKAENLFESCKLLKPDFWPAHFFHGLVLKDVGRDEVAKKSFFKCYELLQGGSGDYGFFLDSFSPAYISSICEKFLT